MNTKQTPLSIIERRAQLMTELLFSDLKAVSASWTISDPQGEDFLLVMFKNDGGGLNTFLVAVIATEKPVGAKYAFPRNLFDKIARSNVPVLLLVADVKQTKLYYAWPKTESDEKHSREETVLLGVRMLDERETKRLRKQLAADRRPQTIAG